MTKHFVITALLVLSGTGAKAAWVQTEISEVCSKISNNRCVDLARKNIFDPWATAACNNINESQNRGLTMMCVEAIANHSYFTSVVRTCDKMQLKDNTITCLKEVADKKFKKEEVDFCEAKIGDQIVLQCLASLQFETLKEKKAADPLESAPSTSQFFDGDFRSVHNDGQWVQLNPDKTFCGGRMRVNAVNTHYVLEIEGSQCGTLRVGFDKQGDRFVENKSVQSFELKKADGSDGRWAGYGAVLEIDPDDVFIYNTNNSLGNFVNRINFVLLSDSREDTHAPAFEKFSAAF